MFIDQLHRHRAHRVEDVAEENSACVHAEARAPLFCGVAASKKLEALHNAPVFPNQYAWPFTVWTRSRWCINNQQISRWPPCWQ